MTHVYDTLMDGLAALAVEAVQDPAMAVQAYWLALLACQESPTVARTRAALLQRAQGDTELSLPPWAQPLASQALERLWRDGVWLETSVSRMQPRGCTDPALPWRTPGQPVVRWQTAYQPYVDEIRDQACRLWQAACRLYGPWPPDLAAVPEEVRRGAVLFDAGLYFACHEYFETLWGRTEDAASDFYQGIIQAAVAMRHLESHQVRGARILLRSGLGRLWRYPSVYQGLHLAAWRERLERLLEHLDALPSPAAYQFDPLQIPPLLDPER
jgi:predicted metal-dependent hydrolase